jgi:UDP-N-acetylglucosamine:LPS N-acetylglucosamine transferase
VDQRPEALIYLLDAGGGHRATANALIAAAAEKDLGFRITSVNVRETIAELDWFGRATGVSLEETYNSAVRRGWTAGLVPILRVFQWTIRRAHAPLVRLLSRELSERRPAVVVSVIPNLNAPLRDAVRAALPGTPFVVLMTDVFDFPPHFWLEPGIDRVVTAHVRGREAADRLGIPPARVSVTSGMVLHPRFYPRAGDDVRRRMRAELGLAEDRFTFLVLYGGKGAPEMHPIAERLLAECPEAAVVAVCGDNRPLVERMNALAARYPSRLHATGFTSRVVEYMAACDLLITKPGPGTLAEAFHQQLPVVVTENIFTVPQERANARWVEEAELGFVVRKWTEIAPLARARLAAPERVAQARANLARLPANRAVDEVLDVLAGEVAAGIAAAAVRHTDVTRSAYASVGVETREQPPSVPRAPAVPETRRGR